MTTPKVVLITGVTCQDGAYLAEFLLNKGYVAHGIKRQDSPQSYLKSMKVLEPIHHFRLQDALRSALALPLFIFGVFWQRRCSLGCLTLWVEPLGASLRVSCRVAVVGTASARRKAH